MNKKLGLKVVQELDSIVRSRALRTFLNELETKEDPEPDRIRLVSEIYNMYEKIFRVINHCNKLKLSPEPLGNKLDRLYSTNRGKLF